ncbi:hypothetical protein QE152_g17029 [Popillia japonica]|uniref:Uncharacterized protein n=1 Tax=Popillia japonica TaxID=7064 RepID=A0AAW1L4M3_POPJA
MTASTSSLLDQLIHSLQEPEKTCRSLNQQRQADTKQARQQLKALVTCGEMKNETETSRSDKGYSSAGQLVNVIDTKPNYQIRTDEDE